MTVSADPSWQRAAAVGDISPGDRVEVTLADGTPVLLVGTDVGIFACCADCPHQETPLAEGSVDGTVLTCPVHFWQWDLKTGEPMGIAELPLPIFETAIEDDTIFVRKSDR